MFETPFHLNNKRYFVPNTFMKGGSQIWNFTAEKNNMNAENPYISDTSYIFHPL